MPKQPWFESCRSLIACFASIGLALSVQAEPGQVDTTFSIGEGFDRSVDQVVVQPDGRVLVGGQFSIFDGVENQGLIRLQRNGAIDEQFTYKDFAVSPSRIRLQPDGRILVQGTFFENGPDVFDFHERLVRMNSDGTVAKILLDLDSQNTLSELVLLTNGAVVVAGDFSEILGQSRNGIARLLPSGFLDEAFDPGRNFGASPFGNVVIRTLLALPGDDLLIGDTTWEARGDLFPTLIALHSDGSLNSNLQLMPANRFPTGQPFVGWDGRILRLETSLERIDEHGSDVPCFDGTLPASPWFGMTLRDGRMLVGVDDSIPVGSEIARVVRLYADGSVDSSFVATFEGGQVLGAVESPEGDYYVYGEFTRVNGQPSQGLVRLLAGDRTGTPQIRFNGEIFGAKETEGKVRIRMALS